MIEPSKRGFPYPLQMGSLEAFCHVVEAHDLGRPYWHQGEAVAVSGYVAVRAARGLWVKSDFEEMPAGLVERLERLPWGVFARAIKDEAQWRVLAEANLFRFGAIGAWLKGRPAPTRVVRVNDTHLVRLSFLQLVARLPRCEVYLGPTEVLIFRFSGGIGMMMKDERLKEAGFSVFSPARHEDGARMVRTTGPCVVKKPEPYWKAFESESGR